jgi:uncharacterized protein (DUF1810 family)
MLYRREKAITHHMWFWPHTRGKGDAPETFIAEKYSGNYALEIV